MLLHANLSRKKYSNRVLQKYEPKSITIPHAILKNKSIAVLIAILNKYCNNYCNSCNTVILTALHMALIFSVAAANIKWWKNSHFAISNTWTKLTLNEVVSQCVQSNHIHAK